MAVLGKIRQRSIFLILVIGMALFAFVISGVFDGSSANAGPTDPIAYVNDEEIDVNFFRQMVEQVASTYIKIIHLIADQLILDYQDNNPTSTPFNFDDVTVFSQDALNGYSDSFFYGSNFWVELRDFDHIQASGLQLTKSPGQFWVYLGSIMLVLGIS